MGWKINFVNTSNLFGLWETCWLCLPIVCRQLCLSWPACRAANPCKPPAPAISPWGKRTHFLTVIRFSFSHFWSLFSAVSVFSTSTVTPSLGAKCQCVTVPCSGSTLPVRTHSSPVYAPTFKQKNLLKSHSCTSGLLCSPLTPYQSCCFPEHSCPSHPPHLCYLAPTKLGYINIYIYIYNLSTILMSN